MPLMDGSLTPEQVFRDLNWYWKARSGMPYSAPPGVTVPEGASSTVGSPPPTEFESFWETSPLNPDVAGSWVPPQTAQAKARRQAGIQGMEATYGQMGGPAGILEYLKSTGAPLPPKLANAVSPPGGMTPFMPPVPEAPGDMTPFMPPVPDQPPASPPPTGGYGYNNQWDPAKVKAWIDKNYGAIKQFGITHGYENPYEDALARLYGAINSGPPPPEFALGAPAPAPAVTSVPPLPPSANPNKGWY